MNINYLIKSLLKNTTVLIIQSGENNFIINGVSMTITDSFIKSERFSFRFTSVKQLLKGLSFERVLNMSDATLNTILSDYNRLDYADFIKKKQLKTEEK